MKHLLLLLGVLSFYGSKAQSFQNVMISNADAPEEISICISPKDTNFVVAGANIAGAFYSHNGGTTWVDNSLTDPYGVWGDPCLVADTDGNFYYFHLAQDIAATDIWPMYCDRVILQKSTDGGITFNTNSYTGFNLPKMQDKAWAAIAPSTNYCAVSWTQFDTYGTYSASDSSRIMFSISKNGGLDWLAPVVISAVTGDCVDSSLTAEGAVPAFGLNGEIYDVWARGDTLWMNQSIDTGKTWMALEKAIATQPGGWDYSVAGLQRCNGLPVTLVDHSNSASRGNLYVNWTDIRNGPDDADVFFIKSTDGGNTWTQPLRVNDDPPGKQNFMSAMTIDETTGDIYILFYDRRNYGDINTDVYMAYSFDGGTSFKNVKVSNTPFYPAVGTFLGDYISISAVNGCVRPAWTRIDNIGTSVWTALINKSQLLPVPSAINAEVKNDDFVLASANPTNSVCIVHYNGGLPFKVVITDISGKPVFSGTCETETFFYRFDESGLSNGTYIINCLSNTTKKTFRINLLR